MITRSDQSRLQLVILYLSTEPSYRPTHHRVPSKLFLQLARASSTFPSHLARALSTVSMHLARALLNVFLTSRARALDVRRTSSRAPNSSLTTRATALDIVHTARAGIPHTSDRQH